MPQTTTNLGLPYPVGGDAPDGPGAVQALAQKIDDKAGTAGVAFVGALISAGASYANKVTRYGNLAVLNFGLMITGNQQFIVGNIDAMLIVPAGFRPAEAVHGQVNIATNGTGWNGEGNVYLAPDGVLHLLRLSTNGHVIAGSIPFAPV